MLLASGCATAPIREYLRDNADGSEAETILVHRPAPDRVEVAKLRARCSSAAYVTARVDRARRTTLALDAGRLRPDAMRVSIGTLARSDDGRALAVVLGAGADARRERLPLPPGAWHLYDFDLADLSAVRDRRAASRAPIRFRLALVWNGDGPLLRDLGDVTLTFERAERYAGRAALRFVASGTSPKFEGGPIWFDRRSGHVLGADWGTPNHAEYRRFRLRLIGETHGGSAAWRKRLTGHFAGCPSD